MQVVSNGSVRQVQPATDFLVRNPFGSELRDPQFLRGQHLPCTLRSSAAGFARRTQFLARAVAPGRSAERIEDIASLTQRSSRVGGPALATTPSAVSAQKTPA